MYRLFLFLRTIVGEAFKTVTTAYESLAAGGEDGLRDKEASTVGSFKKFFNGHHAKAGGDVLEAESDEEVDDLPSEPTPVNSPVSPASFSKTKSSSIYYGPPPPMAAKAVVLDYNELGMPRFSYREMSPVRPKEGGEGSCLKGGVPTFKPKVVGRV